MRFAAVLALVLWGCALGVGAAAPPEALPVPDARPAVYPQLAYDGKGSFLLVWQQGESYFEQQEADIFALRLDREGRPLGAPFPICAAKGSQERPKVVFAAGMFFVVWHDLRNGLDWDVYAARVGADGVVQDGDGFLLAGGPGNQASPEIAPVQGGALVLWQHYDGRFYELHAAQVGTSGKGARGRPLVFRGETLHGGDLALASLRDRLVMSWRDDRQWVAGDSATRYFATLRLDGATPEVLGVERTPAAALGREGGRFVSDSMGAALYMGWGDIGRGRRVAVGAVYGATEPVARANPNIEPELRASSWDPRQMLALFSTRTQSDGPVVGAFWGGEFLVAARESLPVKPPFRSRILGARLSTAGLRLHEADRPLVLHEADQTVANPALAAGSEGFVLVFEQDGGPGGRRLIAKNLRSH